MCCIVRFWFLTSLLGIPSASYARAGAGASNLRAESDANKRSLIDTVASMLDRSSQRGARISYEAICGDRTLWFPKVRVDPRGKPTKGAEPVAEMSTSSTRTAVVHMSGLLLRITAGNPAGEVLKTSIATLTLTPLQQCNETEALSAVTETKEFRSAVTKLHLFEVPVVVGYSLQAPDSDLPHMPAVLRNKTVDEICDQIVRTFGGMIVYGECPDASRNFHNFILTYEFAAPSVTGGSRR
jgi:hypothetical protein